VSCCQCIPEPILPPVVRYDRRVGKQTYCNLWIRQVGARGMVFIVYGAAVDNPRGWVYAYGHAEVCVLRDRGRTSCHRKNRAEVPSDEPCDQKRGPRSSPEILNMNIGMLIFELKDVPCWMHSGIFAMKNKSASREDVATVVFLVSI